MAHIHILFFKVFFIVYICQSVIGSANANTVFLSVDPTCTATSDKTLTLGAGDTFIKVNTGTWAINVDNTSTLMGTIEIDEGTVAIQNAAAFGSARAVTFNTGTILQAGAGDATTPLQLDKDLTIHDSFSIDTNNHVFEMTGKQLTYSGTNNPTTLTVTDSTGTGHFIPGTAIFGDNILVQVSKTAQGAAPNTYATLDIADWTCFKTPPTQSTFSTPVILNGGGLKAMKDLSIPFSINLTDDGFIDANAHTITIGNSGDTATSNPLLSQTNPAIPLYKKLLNAGVSGTISYYGTTIGFQFSPGVSFTANGFTLSPEQWVRPGLHYIETAPTPLTNTSLAADGNSATPATLANYIVSIPSSGSDSTTGATPVPANTILRVNAGTSDAPTTLSQDNLSFEGILAVASGVLQISTEKALGTGGTGNGLFLISTDSSKPTVLQAGGSTTGENSIIIPQPVTVQGTVTIDTGSHTFGTGALSGSGTLTIQGAVSGTTAGTFKFPTEYTNLNADLIIKDCTANIPPNTTEKPLNCTLSGQAGLVLQGNMQSSNTQSSNTLISMVFARLVLQ